VAYPVPFPSFSGVPLEDVQGCNFTLSHGIEPGVAALTVRPLKRDPQETGTLTFTMGGTRVVFPFCRIEDIIIPPSGGAKYWTLKLLDRRWAWRFGEISGWYNRRLADGRLDPRWERTPQQLATLLLQAEGENGFDVSQLPNILRPEVQWSAVLPMQELGRLCDQVGCRVVLGLDNRVRLWRVGNGAPLPVGGRHVTSRGQGFKKRTRPSSIKAVGGPMLFQSKLKLRPVGEDIDGSIKPIAALSYTPIINGNRGWQEAPMGYSGVTATYARQGFQLESRDLAQRTVWKWYQIYSQADGTQNVPGYPLQQPRGPEQLLPLRNDLLEFATNDQGIPWPIPAYVEGKWAGCEMDLSNATIGSVYTGEWSLDQERGIVMFEQPVYQYGNFVIQGQVVNRAAYLPAEMYLVTSYGVRRNDTDMPALTELERKYGGLPAGADIIRTPETQLRKVAVYAGNQVNGSVEFPREGATLAELNAKITAREAIYTIEPSADIEYSGYEAISPDGAIQQVTWNQTSGQTASTRASRNREHRLDLASHEEKRRQREAARLQDLADKKRLDMSEFSL
jgi:hypothetical protein